jgi:glycosyltransferase involved in cell wall biosynthesis
MPILGIRPVTTVSTIIPVYNGEAYIARAVASALEQRHVDVEVVVIDDGSTDGTWEVLEGFGGRIRAIRQPNAGHVRSRNRGAGLATGDWLAFLDADDSWMPDKLASQLALADDRFGLIYTDRLNMGDYTGHNERLSENIRLYEGDVFEELLLGNFVTVSSAIMRRDWFHRLGGFCEDLRVCEDWDLWLRYAAEGGLVRLCPEPLTRYLVHSNSMSHNAERMLEGRLQVIRRALATPRGKRVPAAIARRALACAWKWSAGGATATQKAKAVRWYLRSAWCWPWDLGTYKETVKCLLGMT